MNSDHKGTIVSQESISTCGTNNSAFFRVDIEPPNEMKYSMSDTSITGLVNSLTRSNDEEVGINEQGRDDLETSITNNDTNDNGGSSSSTRNTSQLLFAQPFQRANPSSEDDSEMIYATPFNAETIFRQQPPNPLQAGVSRRAENYINAANPLESSNSDGAVVQQPDRSIRTGLDAAGSMRNTKQDSNDSQETDDREQLVGMIDNGSKYKFAETRVYDDKEQLVATIYDESEIEFEKPDASSKTKIEDPQPLKSVQSHITSYTKRTCATHATFVTAETVIMEEVSSRDSNDKKIQSNVSNSAFGNLLDTLRSQNARIGANFHNAQTSIASFFSIEQMTSVFSICRACNDTMVEKVTTVQTPLSSLDSCNEGIIVEKWAKGMNMKVSDLHDFIKCGSIASINNGMNTFEVIDMGCPNNLKQNRLVDTLMDDASLVECNRMVEKKLTSTDENKFHRHVAILEPNFNSDSTSTPEVKVAEKNTEVNITRQVNTSPEMVATKEFIIEVDKYAAMLGIDRAEFLSRIASMIRERTEEPTPTRNTTGDNMDILDICITSCNPSNLATRENGDKQIVKDDSSDNSKKLNDTISDLLEEENEIVARSSESIIRSKGTTSSEVNSVSIEESTSFIKKDKSGSDGENEANIIDKKDNSGSDDDNEANLIDSKADTTKLGGDTASPTLTENPSLTEKPLKRVKSYRRTVGFAKAMNIKKQSKRFIQRGRFRLRT